MAGGVWQGGGCVAGETATAADGAHPTGMHSCIELFEFVVLLLHLARRGTPTLCLFNCSQLWSSLSLSLGHG